MTPTIYEFRVEGPLPGHCREAFCGMHLEEVPAGLVLRGAVSSSWVRRLARPGEYGCGLYGCSACRCFVASTGSAMVSSDPPECGGTIPYPRGSPTPPSACGAS
jgi:hypothetical protein